MTATGPKGRLFRRAPDAADDQDADLSDDEHAWWAAREEVNGVPHGVTPEEAEEQPDSQFADYWTAESLFEDPPKGVGAKPSAHQAETALDRGLDLDAAHLVLQIPIGSDWEAITTAHRRLAKLYHPDRLISYSPEAQELGRGRMAEINAAHATLRSLHFQQT